MGRIYSSAWFVVIWLGPGNPGSDLVMESLLSGHCRATNVMRFMEALELFLRRDWFSRIWVAQELTLASDTPRVLCGSWLITWQHLLSSVRSIMHVASEAAALVIQEDFLSYIDGRL